MGGGEAAYPLHPSLTHSLKQTYKHLNGEIMRRAYVADPDT